MWIAMGPTQIVFVVDRREEGNLINTEPPLSFRVRIFLWVTTRASEIRRTR